ncbi:MAG: hypothetical protein QXI39_00265 [Candidatus Bathyarchaeia archaeon]
MNIAEQTNSTPKAPMLVALGAQGKSKGFIMTLVSTRKEDETGLGVFNSRERMEFLYRLIEKPSMKIYIEDNPSEEFALKDFSEFGTLSELGEVLKSKRKDSREGMKFLLNFGNGTSSEIKGAIDILEKFGGKGIRIFKSPESSSSFLFVEFEPEGLSRKDGLSLDLFDLEPDAGKESPLYLDLVLPRIDEEHQT